MASILAIQPNTATKLIARLPLGLLGACVVRWNETTILVTGGSISGNVQKRTYFVNFEKGFDSDTSRVTSGPALQNEREDHDCEEIIVKALCLKTLTFVSLRVDVDFETFADGFSLLENSDKFLPIFFYCTITELRRIFKGQKSIGQGFLGNKRCSLRSPK